MKNATRCDGEPPAQIYGAAWLRTLSAGQTCLQVDQGFSWLCSLSKWYIGLVTALTSIKLRSIGTIWRTSVKGLWTMELNTGYLEKLSNSMLGKLQIFAAYGDMIKYWYVVSIYFVPQKMRNNWLHVFSYVKVGYFCDKMCHQPDNIWHLNCSGYYI